MTALAAQMENLLKSLEQFEEAVPEIIGLATCVRIYAQEAEKHGYQMGYADGCRDAYQTAERNHLAALVPN